MIFEKPPPWKWLPERRKEDREFGAVLNTVLIGEGEELADPREVRVVIPTDLVMLLYSRFRIMEGDVVQLMITHEGSRWVMSFSANEEEPIPMFYWTASNKPSWI